MHFNEWFLVNFQKKVPSSKTDKLDSERLIMVYSFFQAY
jgi:hypothetical protein